ncbi:unnamed protein product, partial [Rotaria sp. Silwood1]
LGNVTCYDCPYDANSCDYLITTDCMPDKLNSCILKAREDNCVIDVTWSRNPDKTQLVLTARHNERSI